MRAAWIRASVALVAVLCVGLFAPRHALADDAEDAAWRREVERVWLEGRVGRIAESMPPQGTHIQRFPLFLRAWWRDLPAVPGAVEQVAGDDVSARRIRWIQQAEWLPGTDGGQAPYPMPVADEVDPWPVLTALVLERVRREAPGLDPERSSGEPLRGLGSIRNQDALYALDQGLSKLAEAHGDLELAHATDKHFDQARGLAKRNRTWAWGLLLGLLLLSAILARWGTRSARMSTAVARWGPPNANRSD